MSGAGEDLILYKRTGELVARDDMEGAARLLDQIKEHEAETREAKRALEGVIVDWYRIHGGSKTIELDGAVRLKVVIGSDTVTTYDVELMESGLRAAGMPEEALTGDNGVIKETVIVSKRVDAVKAKQAAKANPAYAKAIEAATTTDDKDPSVSVK